LPKDDLQKLWRIYFALAVAATIQVAGGVWDGMVHLVQPPDDFFTPRHIVVYAGVTLGMVAALAGFFFLLEDNYGRRSGYEVIGIKLAFIGSGLWAFGGPFDYWWHQTLAQESFLILPFTTPSHMVFEIGIMFFMAAPLCGFCCLKKNFLYRAFTPRYESTFAFLKDQLGINPISQCRTSAAALSGADGP